MSERPTPETDDQPTINAVNGNGYQIPCVDIEFARKLERERDEWYFKAHENFKFTLDARTERDEAREKAERYRLEANAMMMQRDEARNECDKLKLLLAADSENVDAYLGVCMERDEAREEIDRYRREAEKKEGGGGV